MSIDRMRVEVDGPVDAVQLASSIRRRLAGGTWPSGPERQVADAVVAARDRARELTEPDGADREVSRWR